MPDLSVVRFHLAAQLKRVPPCANTCMHMYRDMSIHVSIQMSTHISAQVYGQAYTHAHGGGGRKVSYAPGEWPTNGPAVCHEDCGCGQTPASASLGLCIRPVSPSQSSPPFVLKTKGGFHSPWVDPKPDTPLSEIMLFMAIAKMCGHDDTHTHAGSITTVSVRHKRSWRPQSTALPHKVSTTTKVLAA